MIDILKANMILVKNSTTECLRVRKTVALFVVNINQILVGRYTLIMIMLQGVFVEFFVFTVIAVE